MSSMAICAPRRHCWPEYASAPVTGCRTPTRMGLGCAPPTSGKAIDVPMAAVCDRKRRRFSMGTPRGLADGWRSDELRGKLFVDPHLGVDAAHAGQLHLVGIAVRPVQAVQPLHR